MTDPQPKEPALIALENVTVMRGSREGLCDITLRIEAGEHVCILGPNGSGKSTLIKTVTRELYPAVRETSSITIYGQPRWDIFELRTLLGIVSPDLLKRVHGRDVRAGRSPLRIFQQHQDLRAPPHRPTALGTGERGAGELGRGPSGGAAAGADVLGRGEARADRAGAGA